jgi:hypothetical protein
MAKPPRRKSGARRSPKVRRSPTAAPRKDRTALLEAHVKELEKANEDLSGERAALRERAGVIEKRYTELMERTARSEQAAAPQASAAELQSLRRQLDESRRERQEASSKERFWMICPRCGGKLEEVAHEGITLDRCHACAGIYLDRGELEAIMSAKSAGGVFRSLRDLFS